MPAILDVAIGTVFIFLLFSLVVSALNEYLLSLTDQRAKFLRMGLVEIIGKKALPPRAALAAGASAWTKAVDRGERIRESLGKAPKFLRAIGWFIPWMIKSAGTLGGLIQWKDNAPLEVADKKLLDHGLLNGFSRSANGNGTPSYIPPGAFVTALLDLIAGAVPAATRGTAEVKPLTDLIVGLEGARPAPPLPLAFANYKPPLDAFINAVALLAPPPAAGTLLADLRNRVATELALAQVQHELLAATVTDATTARPIIGDPAHAPHKTALDLMFTDADATDRAATAAATAAVPVPAAVTSTRAAADAAYTAFQTAVRDWFSLEKSLTSLQSAATAATASLVASTAQITAAQILAGIDRLDEGHLKTSLLSLFESTGRDVQKFKIAVEGWFNGVMDRVGGWYKRFAQKWMIAIGFVLAAMFNVDTIAVVRELSNNPNLARAVASQAETWVAQNQRPLTAAEQHIQTGQRLDAFKAAEARLTRLGKTTPGTDEEKTSAADALTAAEKAQTNLTAAEKADTAKVAAAKQAVEDATANLKYFTAGGEPPVNLLTTARQEHATAKKDADTLKAYQTAVAKLSESGLPVGWTLEQRKALGLAGWKFDPRASWNSLLKTEKYGEELEGYRFWFSEHFSTLATLSAGWFLTAIAASLGAPFWFDLLGRFVNIRSSGKAPGEKDTTATATRPPAASLDTTPGTRP